MKGHEALLAMRRNGMAPVIVFIDTERDRMQQHRDWQVCTPGMANVMLEAHDNPALLDLRFVVGLLVSISGDSRARVTDVTKACLKAGAKRVIANVCEMNKYGERAIAGITDTAGAMVWEQKA